MSFNRSHTESEKRRISETQKGRLHTKEHCQKISKSLKGKPKTEQHKLNLIGTKGRYKPWNKGIRREDIAGSSHPNWKGGIVLRNGRALIRKDGKYRLRSRIVMEQILGRKLTCMELVHHKNKNTLDDTPDNLEIVTRGRHNQIHIRNPKGEGGKECRNVIGH